MNYGNNINYGTLVEVPQIRIDDFCLLNEDWDINEAFFLSHGHTGKRKGIDSFHNYNFVLEIYLSNCLDHMVGLENFLENLTSIQHPRIKHSLYLHRVTLEHIKYHFKRGSPTSAARLLSLIQILESRDQIRLLEKNRPYRFIFSKYSCECWMTALSAGHSPGSLM